MPQPQIRGEFTSEFLCSRLRIFFFCTILLLVTVFYSIITQQKFWENYIIVTIFLIGFFGYVALTINFLRIFLLEASSFLNEHYQHHTKWYHWGLFTFFVIAGVLSFYIFFGKDASGPIFGGMFVVVVGYLFKRVQGKKE